MIDPKCEKCGSPDYERDGVQALWGPDGFTRTAAEPARATNGVWVSSGDSSTCTAHARPEVVREIERSPWSTFAR